MCFGRSILPVVRNELTVFKLLNLQVHTSRGVNVGVCGGGGGGSPPQRNDPVGLKLSAVGLKIMRLFTRGALRSKLNI